MDDPNDIESGEPENERRQPTLEKGAAPDPVGVYERPERSAPSPTLIAFVVVIMLLLAAVAVYVLVF